MDQTSTLQEVVLVGHFIAPLPLTVLDMAAWAAEFSQYPDAQQLLPASPVDLSGQNPLGMAITMVPEMPRLMLRSENKVNTVQLQSDRFASGWTRTMPVGEIQDYPKFENIKRNFVTEFRKFNNWCERKFGLAPQLKLVELGYNNAAPLNIGSNRRRLSDIFRWVQPSRPVNGFQVAWTELLEVDRPDPGRVNAVVAIGAAPPIMHALVFNFTGFAPIDDQNETSASAAFDKLHQRILDMYESAIIKEGKIA